MEKSFEKHPAYKEDDLEIKTPKELEEAKKKAGVASHETAMKRFKNEDLKNVKEWVEKNFNMDKMREYWREFYWNHGLSKFRDSLPEKINLTKKQMMLISEKAKEGFDKLILLPDVEVQKEYLFKSLVETTEGWVRTNDFPENQQYKGVLWGTDWGGSTNDQKIKEFFPNKLETIDRPSGPYLIFLKDRNEPEKKPTEPHLKTTGLLSVREYDYYPVSNEQLRKKLKEKNETGLTLSEYLIFQRDFTEQCKNGEKPHPDTENTVTLLNSQTPHIEYKEIHLMDHSGHYALNAKWNPKRQKVELHTSGSPEGCFRSAVVIPLEMRKKKE